MSVFNPLPATYALLPANGSITIAGDIPFEIQLNFIASALYGPFNGPFGYPNYGYYAASATVSSGLGPDGFTYDDAQFCQGFFCGLDHRLPSGYVDISDQFRTLTISTGIMTYNIGAGSEYSLYLGLPDGLTVAVPEPATWLLLLIGFVALSAVKRRLMVQTAPTS